MARRRTIEEDMFATVGQPIMVELHKYIGYLELKNSSDQTIKNAIYMITRFNDYLLSEGNEKHSDVNAIKTSDIEEYIVHLKRINLKAISINAHIKVLKAFFNWMAKTKDIKKSPFADNAINLMKVDAPIKHVVSESEFKRLCEGLDLQKFADVTTYVSITILFYTGIRIGELQRLNVQDIDFENREILIHKTKGRRGRKIAMHRNCANVIKNYLKIRGNIPDENALIVNINNKRITDMSISWKIKNLARKCELNGITAHAFRRSTATRLIAKGVDIYTVKEIMGWANLSEALRYIEISDGQKKDAINKL